MIIDIINQTGEQAYFKDAAGNLNLAQTIPSISLTPSLGKGKQVNVSGIQFYMEGNDLLPLFSLLEADATGNLIKRADPLITISVMKEVLPGLFVDPYKSRVHTLGGFNDFKRGTFNKCDVFRVNNKPTLVSIGSEKCTWKSIKYELPEDINIDSAYWEIPSSKETPATAFTYSINLYCYDSAGNLITGAAIPLAAGLDPQKPRIKNRNVKNVRHYEFEFTADVKHDSTLTERIVTEKEDTIGRPLLEGIYLVELVQTKFDFYSLQEFIAECSDYNLFEGQNLPIKKMMATLDLSTVLVQSPNEDLTASANEFIKIEIKSAAFKVVTAKLNSSILLKIN